MGEFLPVTQEPILHVDCIPDDGYPLRILKAYRENCNIHWQSDNNTSQIVCNMMNKHCQQRAIILDKAIAILQGTE